MCSIQWSVRESSLELESDAACKAELGGQTCCPASCLPAHPPARPLHRQQQRRPQHAASQPVGCRILLHPARRCHRALISDALLARGHRVVHLGMGKQPAEHNTTRFAVVEGAGSARPHITYPKSEASMRRKGRKKATHEVRGRQREARG